MIEQLVRVRVELKGCGSVDANEDIFSSQVTYSVKVSGSSGVDYMWVSQRDITKMKLAVKEFEGLTIEITKGTEVL